MTTLGTGKKWSLFIGGRYSGGRPAKKIIFVLKNEGMVWKKSFTVEKRSGYLIKILEMVTSLI
jgi:hypothetical protein